MCSLVIELNFTSARNPRDWMSAHVAYKMEDVMLLVTCQGYLSGTGNGYIIKDE